MVHDGLPEATRSSFRSPSSPARCATSTRSRRAASTRSPHAAQRPWSPPDEVVSRPPSGAASAGKRVWTGGAALLLSWRTVKLSCGG